MDLLDTDDVPLDVHEDIISYLKEQDLSDNENEEFIQNISNFTEAQIKDILSELLDKFERTQTLKEDYAERTKAHNQYPLFNLANIVPDFEIDDDMYDKITFRETLIIQHINKETEIAESVGGLCLDIQKATGKPPQERKCTDIDTHLARIMKTQDSDVVHGDEINLMETVPIDKDDLDLEDSLQTQAERNPGKFLLHLSSQFDFNGNNSGSSITTWVDKKLHTLEEIRKEFFTVKLNEGQQEETADEETLIRAKSAPLYKEGSRKLSLSKTDKLNKEKSEKKSTQAQTKNKSAAPSRRASTAIARSASVLPNKKKSGIQNKIKSDGQLRKTSEVLSKKKSLRLKSSASQSLARIASEKLSRERSAKLTKKLSAQIGKGVTELSKDKQQSLKQEKITLIEKSLYVGLLKKYYYVKHFSSGDNVDDRKFISIRKARDFISEGANFLLMRYLAITIYIGSFELSAMYINGDMCRNIYHCTGPESEVINGMKVDICKIQRIVIEECGIEHTCTTILTLQGQIVHQSWEGVSYILAINPLLDISNYDPVRNEQVLLKHAWESDMQLMSKYLDEKVATDLKMKSYMIDHPEFRNMIADYIHAILLLKPEDIIEFTINHFLSFAPQFLPQNDYYN